MAVFRHEVDARLQNLLGGKTRDVLPRQNHLAAEHLVAAEDGADEFRAARADDTRNAEDFARIQVERDVAEAVAAEILHLHDGFEMGIIHRDIRLFRLLTALRVVGQKTLNQHFLGEVFHRAFQRNHTVAHDGHVRRDFKNLGQAVRDINDGNALFLEILHRFKQRLHLVEGQGAGRLVQNQNLRIAHHAAQKLDQLLLGDGKRVGLALKVQIEVQFLHAAGQALFQFAFVFIEAHQDVFQNRHVREKHRLLRHQINAVRQRRGGLAQFDRLPVDEDIALVARINAHDDLHERRFTGAIAANQRDNLARIHAQIDPLEHGVLPKRFANALDLKARGRRILCGHIIYSCVLRLQRFARCTIFCCLHFKLACAICQDIFLSF